MKKIIFPFAILTVALTSCLKDKPDVDFSNLGVNIDLVESGKTYFAQDAITDAKDTITKTFTINISSPNTLSTDEVVTLGVDNSIVTSYNAANPGITYTAFPTTAFKLPVTTVTIKAGQRIGTVSVTIYKNQLDPSLSYMLPIKIVSVSTGTISGNFGVHYYHVIGNDFAGSYTWDYRRYNNGTGPGAGLIPSLGQGLTPDGGSFTGKTGTISPVSPTEFKMETGYNANKVMYDVTFTRTVSNGVVTYSNWVVKFLPGDIAIWAGLPSPITNIVPPKFTIPPPTKATDPKIFEINHTSGGASPRYIDDTYHK